MASGDTLAIFTAHVNQPPPTGFATIDLRNSHMVLDFQAADPRAAIFGGVLPRNYAGGGITVRIYWMASTATSGGVKWNAQFERHESGTTDLDADDFAAAQTVTTAAPATSGAVQYTNIAFTDGAQIDSLAVGESFRLKIVRDTPDAGDNMAGDAQLLRVELRET